MGVSSRVRSSSFWLFCVTRHLARSLNNQKWSLPSKYQCALPNGRTSTLLCRVGSVAELGRIVSENIKFNNDSFISNFIRVLTILIKIKAACDKWDPILCKPKRQHLLRSLIPKLNKLINSSHSLSKTKQLLRMKYHRLKLTSWSKELHWDLWKQHPKLKSFLLKSSWKRDYSYSLSFWKLILTCLC